MKATLNYDLFSKKNENTDELSHVFSSSSGWELLNKCNLLPRNKLWYPYLANALSTSGAPVSFNVGIAHFVGDDGLIAMLNRSGYTNIKRIYSIK